MTRKQHGLSIGINRENERFFISLKAQGILTHRDYETITPLLDGALAEVNDPKVRIMIDGSEFEGWELQAAWDDLKLGLKHGSEFERIAIYGNADWQQWIARIASWFIAGEVRFFDNYIDALDWLCDNKVGATRK
ncbi:MULTISPECIES: STAS/SEC14 domain-containing protein [unclassified Oceanobacter]|jgi:hypothetical protein|uniref:STAS/SEC14 domain-containing protein n=1 Tax=unclassified Oceanobacter TaxID=2620260 RepID=UPI0027341CD1|nr:MULTISPECIES: STAS/SEC14 domain-containing protein [unclassified Oceanobacter]MDP2505185.1 STAS/SEC14 domain-containing protein [Oceanobacter sp. 3_MG-2023]MDP2548456.1 STAS/SEC14 domain-containing protein [Oceanobacter sp. 4_MG-2023]MDP2610342.1 STAS/SEC14 domain-containing protein [Oceanobacter sp. 1_MG-2023]MDP2613719.1 STAS/SEC14 domain-containing protein [Oceanobacter sp. 2_MG-2023]